MYLSRNWNTLLAIFVLYHEIRGERKYKLQTSGVEMLDDLEALGVDTSHASIYQPLNYFILEKLMNATGKLDGSFVDLGCGKGRVLAVAAFYGFEEIIGVDFSKNLCDAAKRTILESEKRFPDVRFSVINNDAFYFDIPDQVNTIFLFNPFDEVIMSGVIQNIMFSLKQSPRAMQVLYANPVYKSLFLAEGFTETLHIKKLEYLEGSILEIGA